MRCVCGRSYQNHLRDITSFLVVVLAFGFIVHTARERRGLQADRREARAMIQQADSLMRDWVERGCAPRTKALP